MFSSQSVGDFLSTLKAILVPRRETMTLTVTSLGESTCLYPVYGGMHVAFVDVPCQRVIFQEFPSLVFSTYRDDLRVGEKAQVTVVLDMHGAEESRLWVE